jgi:hypothetical protein
MLDTGQSWDSRDWSLNRNPMNLGHEVLIANKYLLVETVKIASQCLCHTLKWKYLRRVHSIQTKRSRYILRLEESWYPSWSIYCEGHSPRCPSIKLISLCKVVTNIRVVLIEVFRSRWPSRVRHVGWTSDLSGDHVASELIISPTTIKLLRSQSKCKTYLFNCSE